MLGVAEGGLLSMNDILVSMGEKVVTAASDSLGNEERQAISNELVGLVQELNDIARNTEFNGNTLLDSAATFDFWTSSNSSLSWTSGSFDTASLGMSAFSALTATDVIDQSNYETYLDEASAALSTVSSALTDVGSILNRLTIKQSVASTTAINTEAAYSRIFNADIAREQLEVTKFQILQQTAMAVLSQANLNPRSVLQLFP